MARLPQGHSLSEGPGCDQKACWGRDGKKKTARTDLVLDKPTGQLLRGAVPLSLDTPDENSPVYSLHVQRAIHGLLLVGVLAFRGGGGPRVGGRARRSQVLLGGAVGLLGGHDRTNTGGQLASRGGREGSSRNKAARSCDRRERGKVEEACRRRVWSCRCRASCEGGAAESEIGWPERNQPFLDRSVVVRGTWMRKEQADQIVR